MYACDTVRMNKRDFYQGKNGLFAAPKNRFCDGNDFDAICEPVCICVSVSFCVFARECFADQMHLLFNSPSQQAAPTMSMHTLPHAHPHNHIQTYRTGDEYGDEDETSLQIFGLWDWRQSSGNC